MRSVSSDKSVKVTASAQSRGKITRTSLFPVLEKIYRKDFSTLNCIAVNKLYGKELPHCVSEMREVMLSTLFIQSCNHLCGRE